MKSNGIIWIAAGAIVLIALSKTAQAATSFDLSYLSSTYGTDPVNRLQSLANAYSSQGLNQQQIKFVLSQDLFESGLFTDVANYNLMNQNNYAGLTNIGGGYAAYSSIPDFVAAHIGFLSKGSSPIDANNLSDFNNRLVQNHYYTESPQIYYNGLLTYYNLLS